MGRWIWSSTYCYPLWRSNLDLHGIFESCGELFNLDCHFVVMVEAIGSGPVRSPFIGRSAGSTPPRRIMSEWMRWGWLVLGRSLVGVFLDKVLSGLLFCWLGRWSPFMEKVWGWKRRRWVGRPLSCLLFTSWWWNWRGLYVATQVCGHVVSHIHLPVRKVVNYDHHLYDFVADTRGWCWCYTGSSGTGEHTRY